MCLYSAVEMQFESRSRGGVLLASRALQSAGIFIFIGI